MTGKNALDELEAAGLIERQRRGHSLPNRIYAKIPDEQDIVRLTDKKLSVRGKENCPLAGLRHRGVGHAAEYPSWQKPDGHVP